MADNTTIYDLVTGWSATNRYTASGDTDVLVSNVGGGWLRWATTTDDTAPTIPYSSGHMIKPGEGRAMTLADGARLWLAGTDKAALEV